LVEAGALDQLAEGHLLSLQVTLEHCQLSIKDLVLVLGSALQLPDGDLELAVHVVLFLFRLLFLLVQFYFLLLDSLEAFLDVLKAALRIIVAHQVVAVVLDTSLQVLLL